MKYILLLALPHNTLVYSLCCYLLFKYAVFSGTKASLGLVHVRDSLGGGSKGHPPLLPEEMQKQK